MSRFDAVSNLAWKAMRRLQAAHKPLVRRLRRGQRSREQRAFRDGTLEIERELAALARSGRPIIAGPWLAEVGYEVLYWIPFLRWLADAHGIPRERLVIVSRGGMDAMYDELAATYVDIFDLMSAADLAAANARRQAEHEGGGRKQSAGSALDDRLIAAVRARFDLSSAVVLHPSLLFRLFREVWHGNLPVDVFTTHTRYDTRTVPVRAVADLPDDFIAAKLYAGPALTASAGTRAAVRELVARAAAIAPVVLLETELGIDEHRDFDLRGLANVTSVGALMEPRTNLGLQLSIIARSRFFLGTCGGLAWMAPFLGVPTVALYDDDALLGPHLSLARLAGRAAGAAAFTPLDLRALDRLALLASPAAWTTGRVE